MHPWQQIGLEDAASVRAMNSYRQGGPVFRLTHQGSVPLTPSDPIVYARFWNNKPCAPRPPQMVGISRCASTPRQHTVEVSASLGPQQASHLPINAPSSVHPVDVHVQSVHPVVCAFGYNKPSFLLVLFVDRVVAIDRYIYIYIDR